MSLINTAYFNKIKEQAELVTSCADLQRLTDETLEALYAQQTALNEQIAALAPIIALANLSLSDLPSVITFLNTLKTALLGPYIALAAEMTAQITAQLVIIAELVAAFEEAASRIGSCSITIPPP